MPTESRSKCKVGKKTCVTCVNLWDQKLTVLRCDRNSLVHRLTNYGMSQVFFKVKVAFVLVPNARANMECTVLNFWENGFIKVTRPQELTWMTVILVL